MRMEMRLIGAAASVALAVLVILVDPAVSVVRKCFSCRSRGPLGDCRDPFYLSANATIIESKKSGVETPPCSSGWCRKVIEGRENREGQTRAMLEIEWLKFKVHNVHIYSSTNYV